MHFFEYISLVSCAYGHAFSFWPWSCSVRHEAGHRPFGSSGKRTNRREQKKRQENRSQRKGCAPFPQQGFAFSFMALQAKKPTESQKRTIAFRQFGKQKSTRTLPALFFLVGFLSLLPGFGLRSKSTALEGRACACVCGCFMKKEKRGLLQTHAHACSNRARPLVRKQDENSMGNVQWDHVCLCLHPS
nr:hypothetical protein [Pandoravirus massiliensis]